MINGRTEKGKMDQVSLAKKKGEDLVQKLESCIDTITDLVEVDR